MKNLKVSLKLMVSFMIIAALTAVVGIVGVYGMARLHQSTVDMYYNETEPMPDIAKALEYIQRLRVEMAYAVIYTGESDRLRTIETDMRKRDQDFTYYMEHFEESITSPNIQNFYDAAMRSYTNDFKPGMNAVLSGALNGADTETLEGLMEATYPSANTIVENLTKCLDYKVQSAENAYNSDSVLYRILMIAAVSAIVLALAVAISLAIYISGLISKPLQPLTHFMHQAGETGNLTLDATDEKLLGEYQKRKDEIGQVIAAALHLISHVSDAAKDLEIISSGDLTVELEMLSDRDTLSASMHHMTDNLNRMFGEINTATAQVTTGAGQIADAAQNLAQGSTEQAATVQELSASVAEIAQKTKDNAELASRSAELANTIQVSAEKGSRQMNEMMDAVNEINEASQSISKVIKVIDNIAFQTNILALNAAVEAARAGQHGKGFSVVAEEVRNLAAKSADAAKDTGELIANSIQKAELGARIATDTSASLVEIVSGISESSTIAGEIARSSEEQSTGIAQVNEGIDQVAMVVQQNSATAEQSAAASEELSSQATMLEQLISQFKLIDMEGVASYHAAAAARPPYSSPSSSGYRADSDSSGFSLSAGDKY